ncbi:flagella synthesis protein FlgN [Thiolapillus sp.]
MMQSEETDFHRHLYSLLDQELNHMGELKQILDSETAVLTYERNTDELLQLIAEKDAKVAALKELETERNQLFNSIGVNTHPQDITQFLRIEVEARPLLPLWQQLLELATQCQESNRLNGTIIKLDSQHLQQALNLLREENTSNCNYDPQGCTAPSNTSRLLGQA